MRFSITNCHLLQPQIFSMRVAKLYKDNTEQITNIHYRFVEQSNVYFWFLNWFWFLQQWWTEHHNLKCRRPDYHLRLRERDPEAGSQQQKVRTSQQTKFSMVMFNLSRYGVDLIHFTQNKGHAVHASTKENDIIRFGDNHAWLKEKELEEKNCLSTKL